MASEGPKDPGTAATSNGNGGTIDWTNPDNAKVLDSFVAVAGDGATPGLTYRLILTNFGFSAVSGTLNGIVVDLYKTGVGAVDAEVYLTKNGATPVGSNKADTVTAWPEFVTQVTYGGATDLWGSALTALDVLAGGFGVIVAATLDATGTAHVDVARVTVHYTPGAGGNLDDGGLCVASRTYWRRQRPDLSPARRRKWHRTEGGILVPDLVLEVAG